jgi:hypothetical protein
VLDVTTAPACETDRLAAGDRVRCQALTASVPGPFTSTDRGARV